MRQERIRAGNKGCAVQVSERAVKDRVRDCKQQAMSMLGGRVWRVWQEVVDRKRSRSGEIQGQQRRLGLMYGEDAAYQTVTAGSGTGRETKTSRRVSIYHLGH